METLWVYNELTIEYGVGGGGFIKTGANKNSRANHIN